MDEVYFQVGRVVVWLAAIIGVGLVILRLADLAVRTSLRCYYVLDFWQLYLRKGRKSVPITPATVEQSTLQEG